MFSFYLLPSQSPSFSFVPPLSASFANEFAPQFAPLYDIGLSLEFIEILARSQLSPFALR
jgi:hypothetical protein